MRQRPGRVGLYDDPASRAESFSAGRPDGQLVGEFADATRDRLRDGLAERRPALDWATERRVRRTPVDVVGESTDGTDSRFVAVELEWRRFRERSERLLVRERAKRVD